MSDATWHARKGARVAGRQLRSSHQSSRLAGRAKDPGDRSCEGYSSERVFLDSAANATCEILALLVLRSAGFDALSLFRVGAACRYGRYRVRNRIRRGNGIFEAFIEIALVLLLPLSCLLQLLSLNCG